LWHEAGYEVEEAARLQVEIIIAKDAFASVETPVVSLFGSEIKHGAKGGCNLSGLAAVED
jgi:hypothetical protein